MKARIRAMMELAARGEKLPLRRDRRVGSRSFSQDQLTEPIQFTAQERFIVSHVLRCELKEFTNPLAIAAVRSALMKLDNEPSSGLWRTSE